MLSVIHFASNLATNKWVYQLSTFETKLYGYEAQLSYGIKPILKSL
jgi:hypothetical protein